MDMSKRAVSQPPVEEKPVAASSTSLWGSDAIAAALRALDIPYIALIPARATAACTTASSTISATSARRCSCACTRSTRWRSRTATTGSRERMMAAALHANVGLMHAVDVDLQRVVRPRAGAGAGRDRAGGRGEAPAVDRLDPHRARPGRAGARLHQVGRPAGVGRAAQESLLRAALLANTAPRGPVYVCLDAGLQESRLDAAADAAGRRTLHAAAAGAAGARGHRAARGAAPRRREASRHSRRPRRPQRGRLAGPRRARREARRARADRASRPRRRSPPITRCMPRRRRLS